MYDKSIEVTILIKITEEHEAASTFLAHGWRSHAMGGTGMALDHSLTHSLTRFSLTYSLKSDLTLYSYLPYLVLFLFQMPFTKNGPRIVKATEEYLLWFIIIWTILLKFCKKVIFAQ